MPFKDPEARRAYNRKYEAENRERIRERNRKYHAQRREQTRAYHEEWVKANPDKAKTHADRYYMKKYYGMTPERYQALLEEQGGRCACCGKDQNIPNRKFAVDHDHLTGAIRGLLCHNCNVGIGHLGDSIEGVRRALTYLERAPQSSSAGATTNT